MTTQRQDRRSSRATIVAVALASLAIHATIFATAEFGSSPAKSRSSEDATLAAAAELEFSCWSDAVLGLTARELACTTPWGHAAGCQEQALGEFRIEWLLCEGLEDAPTSAEALAFLTPEEIDSLEPAPILDVPEVDQVELETLLEEEVKEKQEEVLAAASNPRERGQVIEVTQPELEATPDKARFLSEFDSYAEKETVARGSTEEMVARPAPKDIPVAEKETDGKEPASAKVPLEKLLAANDAQKDSEGGEDGQADEVLKALREMQYRPEMRAGDVLPSVPLGAGALGFRQGDGPRDLAGRAAREAQEASSGGQGGGSPVPNLRPSEETLARLAGGGSVDRLDGVESGEFTALNTKKWKFASFFNRMKRQVAQNWHPDQVYARRDPTGKVYGTKDRVTLLDVSLKPDGSLDKIVVLEESGVPFLDAEAVNAFERAQPFPNPPSGLIDSSGGIHFSFGFHFQVGAPRGGWRIFRNR